MSNKQNKIIENNGYCIGIDSKGRMFKFDKEDEELIKAHIWHVTDEGYVKTNINRKSVMLHRLLMDVDSSMEVDHINHEKNDCRKSNLRMCQRSGNMRNRTRQSNNTAGFKGVTKNRNKWLARIKVDGKHVYLGLYDTPELAHNAYVQAAKKHHGEYACVE